MPFARNLTLVATLTIVLAGCATRGAGSPSASEGPPRAPAGMQLLGAQGIVIAVPDTWDQVGDDPCLVGVPDRSYVLHELPTRSSERAARTRTCLDEAMSGEGEPAVGGDEGLVVGVGPMYTISVTGAGEPDPTPTPTPLVRDDLTVDAWVQCDDLGAGLGVPYCAATWEIGDRDLSFSVRVLGDGGPELLETMSDSIRRLPEGWTTSETDGTVVHDQD